MPPPVLLAAAWLLAVNVGAFLAFASDKRRAVARLPRIPERRLLQISALGGGVGAFAAQQAFRHKTRKQPFQTRFRTILALQVAAAVVLVTAGDRLPPW